VSVALESQCYQGVGAFKVHLLEISALPSPERLPSARLLEAGLRAGRSKAFSPVCLLLFSELQPLFPITTQSPKGEGRMRRN